MHRESLFVITWCFLKLFPLQKWKSSTRTLKKQVVKVLTNMFPEYMH